MARGSGRGMGYGGLRQAVECCVKLGMRGAGEKGTHASRPGVAVPAPRPLFLAQVNRVCNFYHQGKRSRIYNLPDERRQGTGARGRWLCVLSRWRVLAWQGATLPCRWSLRITGSRVSLPRCGPPRPTAPLVVVCVANPSVVLTISRGVHLRLR